MDVDGPGGLVVVRRSLRGLRRAWGVWNSWGDEGEFCCCVLSSSMTSPSIIRPWMGPWEVLSVSVSLRTVCFCPERTESCSERIRSSFRGRLRSGLLAVACWCECGCRCSDISSSSFEDEAGESSSAFEDSLGGVKRLSNNIEKFRRKLKSCENTNANKSESLRLLKFPIDVMVSSDLHAPTVKEGKVYSFKEH